MRFGLVGDCQDKPLGACQGHQRQQPAAGSEDQNPPQNVTALSLLSRWTAKSNLTPAEPHSPPRDSNLGSWAKIDTFLWQCKQILDEFNSKIGPPMSPILLCAGASLLPRRKLATACPGIGRQPQYTPSPSSSGVNPLLNSKRNSQPPASPPHPRKGPVPWQPPPHSRFTTPGSRAPIPDLLPSPSLISSLLLN